MICKCSGTKNPNLIHSCLRRYAANYRLTIQTSSRRDVFLEPFPGMMCKPLGEADRTRTSPIKDRCGAHVGCWSQGCLGGCRLSDEVATSSVQPFGSCIAPSIEQLVVKVKVAQIISCFATPRMQDTGVAVSCLCMLDLFIQCGQDGEIESQGYANFSNF